MTEVISEKARLSGWLNLPETVFESKDWSTLVDALAERLREFEKVKSAKLLLEVEVEQLQRDAERRSEGVQRDATQGEEHLEALKQEISAANETIHGATTQNLTLREQIAQRDLTIRTQKQDTERLVDEKRQALLLVDRQSKSLGDAETSFAQLNTRHRELRTTVSELQDQLSVAKLAESAAIVRTLRLIPVLITLV
jgi:chromosome segregation ATPase